MVLQAAMVACVRGLAEDPAADDQYLLLFRRIQDAERLARSPGTDETRRLLSGTLNDLLRFQSAHPAWHPDIVAFRIRFLRDRLAGLDGQSAPDASPAEAAPGSQTNLLTGTVLRLEMRLRELEYERDHLKARLREALAARPAPSAAPELLRAQERARALQKELDLLRVSQAIGQSNVIAVAKAEADDKERRDLLERLETQQVQLRALEEDRERLQTRVRELEQTSRVGDSGRASASEQGRADSLDDALLVLGRAAEAAPDSPEALCRFAQALADRGMTESAEAVCQRALGLDPTCSQAHYELSQLSLRHVPPALALARWHYQEALRNGRAPDPELEALLNLHP